MNQAKQTQHASELLHVIGEDIIVAKRMLRASGFSAFETRVTIIAHNLSDLLAITADQSFGVHYWDSTIAQTFVLIAELGEVAKLVASARGYQCS